jgi:hypothetical protein
VIVIAKVDEATGKRRIVENGIIRIQDFREDDDRDRRTTRGEWPSKCCQFDGPLFCMGYDADSQDQKRTISIKAIPYFRTQDDDGHPFTKALYDHASLLPSEVERQYFDAVLDDILFRFLYEVKFPLPCSSLHYPVLFYASHLFNLDDTPSISYMSCPTQAKHGEADGMAYVLAETWLRAATRLSSASSPLVKCPISSCAAWPCASHRRGRGVRPLYRTTLVPYSIAR